MKTRYDPDTDALYMGFAEAPVVETEEVRPGVMLDFDVDGRIVAIEVLEASERLSARTEPSSHDDSSFDEVARLVPRRRIDADVLRSLTAETPPQGDDASTLIRSMRDGARY